MESRRAWTSPSSRFPSSRSVSKLLFFPSRVFVSFLLLLSRVASWASRSETVRERAESPFAALRTWGGESLKVAEIVSKLLASWSVSISPMVSPSPLNAWVTSYGEVVRLAAIREPGSCGASPRGSTARYFSPSSVLMAMPTVEESPIQASFTRKSTRTFAPSRETPVTSPTFTPAMRTSSPSSSPADSVKSAL